MPNADEIVEIASEAAEDAVFDAYDRSAVPDLDVTVQFVGQELTVDVYLDAGADSPEEREREEEIVNRAMRAAEAAVDEVVEDSD